MGSWRSLTGHFNSENNFLNGFVSVYLTPKKACIVHRQLDLNEMFAGDAL